MGIIQNIKYQYKFKLLEDLFKNSNFKDINLNFSSYSKDNPEECLKLLKSFIKSILEITTDQKILNDNLVLINSYDRDDGKLVTDFLNFYLGSIEEKNFLITTYQDQQFEILNKLKKTGIYDENDFFDNSLFYQALMTFIDEEKIKILQNHSSFFSTQSNLNFTNSRLTKCYFLIIDHPYKAYESLKEKIDSKDMAMNEFLNLDNKPFIEKKDGIEISIPRKSWQIFHNSWSDPNVLNTLRGAIIKKESLYSDPEEFFTSVILHLRQSNYEIPLKYNLIDQYISNNLKILENDYQSSNLSNKEKKMIDREINQASDNLGFIL